MRENQCGFRTGCSCVDQLFAIGVLAEKVREYYTPLHVCYVDLNKAYGSVSCDVLWVIVEKRY